MADTKEKVKFRKFVNNEREALALDKVRFDSNTNTLTLYSSFDPSIKEEVVIPTSNIELDTGLTEYGKAADAKAHGAQQRDQGAQSFAHGATSFLTPLRMRKPMILFSIASDLFPRNT